MPSAAQVWKALLVGFVVAATAAAWLVDQETSDRHRVASTLLVLVTAWILAWACAALVRTRRTETRRGRVVAWCLLVAAVVVGACGVLATAGDPRQGDSLWLLGIALGLAAIGAFAVVAVRRDWFRPRKARVALAAIVGFALAACLLALAQWRVPSEPLDGAGFRTTTSSSTTSTTAADADHDVQRGTDLCDLGARLAEAGLDDQARAAYTRALRTDRSNYECAYDGLDELAPDPPPPPDAGSVLDRMGTNLRRIGGATLDLFALEPLTRLRWGIGETFVLLALLALLLRTIRRRSKLRRPAVDIVAPTGTIEEDEPDKDALAAVLRDALATAGVLPASTVPGGALGAEVEAVVTQNPLADKVGLAKIGSFLAGIIDPKVGYKVESTIRNRSGEDPAGLTVEATDLRSGTKRFISTVWAATHTAAAEAAAYRVIAEVSALAPEPPEWRRWRSLDGEGIQRYFSALALQRAGDLTGARAAALEAVASEPRNARVRLTLAEIDEHGGAWLEAIESYAAVLAEYRQDETFPSSNIRYRLATAMSYVEDWKDDWAELVLPRREALQQLLVVAGVLPDPSVLPVAKDDLVEEFLAVAEAIYTEHPASGWEDDVDPLDPATVAMAKSCTELQRLQAAGDDLDDRKLLVAAAMKNVPLPGRAPAGARYNAACLLARRLRDSDVQGSASTRRQLARQAVEQLQAAVRDPKGELDRQRLHYLFESDPDLEPLRREPAFLAWRARLQGQWPPLLSATAEALSDELLDLRRLDAVLGGMAVRLVELWRDRMAKAPPLGTEHHALSLRWWSQELGLWQKLQAAKSSPRASLEPLDETACRALWKMVDAVTGTEQSFPTIPVPTETKSAKLRTEVESLRAQLNKALRPAKHEREVWDERVHTARDAALRPPKGWSKQLDDWAQDAYLGWLQLAFDVTTLDEAIAAAMAPPAPDPEADGDKPTVDA